MIYVVGPQFWDPFLAPSKSMILQIPACKKRTEPSELANRNARTRWADHDDHPKNPSAGSTLKEASAGRQAGRQVGRQADRGPG